MLHAGTSFILRLPCKIESNFQVIVEGRKLANYVMKQVTVKTVNECYQKCEDQNGCNSVNYRGIGSDNCQLNKRIRETVQESNFEVSDSWEYHATNYNTTNVSNVYNCVLSVIFSLHCIYGQCMQSVSVACCMSFFCRDRA